MEPFVLQNPTHFVIEKWMSQFPGLVAGMTTKNEGFSKGEFKSLNLGFHVGDNLCDVVSNRQKVSENIQFPLEYWVGAEQTHHHVIQKVKKVDRGKGATNYEESYKGIDGFYTDETGILLTLCYADCVPLFFIAPMKRMIGLAHAGWKGTTKEIAKQMIELWKGEGIPPEEIFVVIGPSICKKCYIVNKYVIDIVQKILVDVEKKPYNLFQEDQYFLDLRELNRLLLRKAGVPEQNIAVTEYCSSCHENEFFSHRRDKGKSGRMLSFIGWKEDSSYL
ncbi:MAG: peptidoglycan editing factor PgeF [Bacillota bacterium]|nr:peptidoglycan editing factor PgeF [Bacillota bacterium]